MESYNGPEGAKQYIDFIESGSGKYEQVILPKYILPALGTNKSQKILDAGCGTGWLTNILSQTFSDASGCDGSTFLIDYAKQHYPNNKFSVCDLTGTPSALISGYDAVVANMSLHDMNNVPAALKNFYTILKPGGKLIITISNPYYSLPVGVWKRGLIGRIFGQMPKLQLRPYFSFKTSNRKFSWGKNVTSNFYTLPEYINWAIGQGFVFKKITEVQAEQDSPEFNLQHQLYQFPYILMMEFVR